MRLKASILRNAGFALLSVAIGGTALTGCTTTAPENRPGPVQQRAELNSEVHKTLEQLYRAAPESRALVQQAKGALVFPNVLGASFVIGAEHGDGALLVNNENAGYYTTTTGSVGFQAGAQSRAVIYLFMTQEALNRFRSSDGWTAGASASVAVADVGANGSIDTRTANQPVIGFVLNNSGIQGGVSLDGAKITQVNP